MVLAVARFKSSKFLPVETPKSIAYAAFVENEEALHHRNVDVCQTVRTYPGVFERIRGSTTRIIEM
jgi:hypothetical protein